MKKVKRIQRKIRLNKRTVTLFFVSLMVIILFFSGYSIGKGIFETDIRSTAEIAEPILVVDNNPAINMTTSNNVGSYEFKVKNYDDTQKITQTDLKYNIELISNINDEVETKLYKNGKEIPMENNKTQDLYFYKNMKEEHNYKLEIMYDKEKSNPIEETIQNIQIKVHSEQMKT